MRVKHIILFYTHKRCSRLDTNHHVAKWQKKNLWGRLFVNLYKMPKFSYILRVIMLFMLHHYHRRLKLIIEFFAI